MRAGDMREHNTAAVLRAVVHARGGISRAEISTALGLTRSTVSAIVDALLGAGLLTAGTPIAGGTGRPRVPLRPADAVAGLGAEISADRVRVVARSVSGHRLACRDAFADASSLPPAQVVALLADTVDAVRAGLPRTADVIGLTVSVPGRIGRDGRTVVSAPNLGWTDVLLADLLGSHAQLAALSPVLANDSDLAARYEAISRPGESFVLIHGETGIGGAIVVDGRILRGETGWAGEIGHINIVPDGAPCGCGRRGCLEAYAGFHTLRRALDLPEGTHLDDLARALASPDARTRELVAEVGEHLGAVIAAVLNVLDLSTVVLSGYFRALAPQLAPSVRAVLRERALRPEAELVQSAGDGRQEADGAAREALEPFWRDVTGWIAARG